MRVKRAHRPGLMRAFSILLLMCVAVAICAGARAADDGAWQLRLNRDGIKVYTRAVTGSRYYAFKATMTIRSSLSAPAALLRDESQCPKWQTMCARATKLSSVSPQEMIVYEVNDMPWPVADRDVVMHVQWHQDEKTLAVTMQANAVSGIKPHQRGLIRLTEVSSRWTFTPMGNGMINVTTEAHANPGGGIPSWLVNRSLADSPFETLTNLRKILATGRFDDAKVGFIKEPG